MNVVALIQGRRPDVGIALNDSVDRDIFTVGKTVIFMSANNSKNIAETNYKELKDLIFP